MGITLKSCSMVKPAKPTPNSHACLSDCDQDKPTTHAPIIYFFKPSDPFFSFPLACQTLKDSLSEVLVHFYPLAGRLHLTEDGGRVRLECNSAGAMFFEAESDAKIEDFKDFAPTKELRSLVPPVDPSVPLHQQPIVLVQLTRLSCGGISLGTAISHTMVDGTAASHFVLEWARIARGEPLLNPPFLDRSILLGSTKVDYSNCKSNRYDPLPLLLGARNNFDERTKETNVAMLHLSVADVLKLKDMANEGRPSNIRPYSAYEAVAGHVWQCASKARSHCQKQPTKLAIPVNFRKCMSPILPKWYFGNAYYRTFASSTSGELITKPLTYAASKIRKAIEMVTEDNVKLTLALTSIQPDLTQIRTYHMVGSTQGSFVGNPNIDIVSWLGIPLNGTDFGFGNEIYMGPGSINLDGKCFILPGRSDIGSVTVALRLQVSHMDSFKKMFYDLNRDTVVQLSDHLELVESNAKNIKGVECNNSEVINGNKESIKVIECV